MSRGGRIRTRSRDGDGVTAGRSTSGTAAAPAAIAAATAGWHKEKSCHDHRNHQEPQQFLSPRARGTDAHADEGHPRNRQPHRVKEPRWANYGGARAGGSDGYC